MARKKVRNPHAHLSTKRWLIVMATPIWRRTKFAKDPNANRNPFVVPRPALNGKATVRTKKLAKPKVQQKDYNYFERTLRFTRGMITEEPSQRIMDLAVPKRNLLLYARGYGVSLNNSHLVSNINGQLRALKKSRYQKTRAICNALAAKAATRQRRIRRRLFRCIKTQADEAAHLVELSRLARPKRGFEPPPVDRGPKLKVNEARLRVMATRPKRKHLLPAKEGVRPGALIYEITDRMAKLAVREVGDREEPIYKEPGAIVPAALTAMATQRTLELAEPAKRPPGLETDIKAEAFGVLPRALTAYCSPRTKELAQPKKRR